MDHDSLKLRIPHRAAVAMGPGKAELLDAIDRCGSISAAAKDMGMSYRRAWELVDVMNHSFTEPLVKTYPGGGKQGGAQVTELGFHILACYRTLMSKIHTVCEQELNEISRHLSATD
ncbi:MAG TPA: winged helix-turn-helix domain-containing protein [Janthinobacterium sp.]|jgi:molybdate transport system regulatory protein|nr:winged helix-turn-helix domain-containing protein [Janthinobacterium sp.]